MLSQRTQQSVNSHKMMMRKMKSSQRNRQSTSLYSSMSSDSLAIDDTMMLPSEVHYDEYLHGDGSRVPSLYTVHYFTRWRSIT